MSLLFLHAFFLLPTPFYCPSNHCENAYLHAIYARTERGFMDIYAEVTQDIVLTSVEEQVGILYVETEHTVQDVGDTLRNQEQPVIISLPEVGEAFSLPEHFEYLSAPDFPEIFRFVIPNSRQEQLCRIAMLEGFKCSSTVEEAIHEYNQRLAFQQEHSCEEQQRVPNQESVSTTWSCLAITKALVQHFRGKRQLPSLLFLCCWCFSLVVPSHF